MAFQARTLKELEILFQRTAGLVSYRAVPVIVVPRIETDVKLPLGNHASGQCHEDKILILEGLDVYQRFYTLFHELGHLYLHYAKFGGLQRPTDEQEFEADWVAHKLYRQFELKPGAHNKRMDMLRYDLFGLLCKHDHDYFQRRVVMACNKINQIVHE